VSARASAVDLAHGSVEEWAVLSALDSALKRALRLATELAFAWGESARGRGLTPAPGSEQQSEIKWGGALASAWASMKDPSMAFPWD